MTVTYGVEAEGVIPVTSGGDCGLRGGEVAGRQGQINHGSLMKLFDSLYVGQGRGCLNRHLAQADFGKGDQQIYVSDVDPDFEIAPTRQAGIAGQVRLGSGTQQVSQAVSIRSSRKTSSPNPGTIADLIEESANVDPAVPAQPSVEERNWAVGAHLSALVTLVGLPSFIGPLVVWLVKKDESPFVGEHARQALNFNLSVLVYLVAASVVSIIFLVVTLGLGFLVLIPVVLIAVVFLVVVLIQASIAASKGETYRYPVTIDFVS